uniref:Uncharacterized protein n=1 Tax=Oryza glumipatula TaxID=40148 RepID=A0A0D9ZBI7_9ORYZ
MGCFAPVPARERAGGTSPSEASRGAVPVPESELYDAAASAAVSLAFNSSHSTAGGDWRAGPKLQTSKRGHNSTPLTLHCW